MEHTDGREILVDDFQDYRIVFFSGDPGRFVVNVDPDFDEVLGEPAGRVKYVLVPSTRLEGSLNQVNITHPLLYQFGAPWASLETEWAESAGEWRLYRVADAPD